jgi:hypothetical protein
MPRSIFRFFCAALWMVVVPACLAQSLPATPRETLSGKHVVLADAVRGHATILVAGFSREGGAGTGDWMKAIHADPAFANATVYQVAMLASAPWVYPRDDPQWDEERAFAGGAGQICRPDRRREIVANLL